MAHKKSKKTPSTAQSQSGDQSDVSDNELIPTGVQEQYFERIMQIFSSVFEKCVDRLIKSVDQRITQRVDVQETALFDLNKRIDVLDRSNKNLESENAEMRNMIGMLKNRLDQVEQKSDELDRYSRNSNALIHGLTVNNDESTGTILRDRVISDLNVHLNLNLTPADINAVHRLRKFTTSVVGSAHQKPPPVIIQFHDREVRNRVLQNRKKLKGKPIVLTEQLTARRAVLLSKATDLAKKLKLQSAWSHEGKILVKTLENRVMVVATEDELRQFN